MKTKTYYIMLALAILFCSIETADACSLNPTAVITTDPDGTVFYNGDPVLLSGENSTANCGFITQYLWRVRPEGGSWTTIYTGSSPTYSYTFPILNDGESEKSYQIMLRVRNSSGRFGYAYQWVTVKHSHESYYYLTDHLGSVRVTVDERGDPVGWDDYYPFGLQMPGRSQQQYGSPETDVKFTGHELNQEGGLGLYHAGARLYDPTIGRFMQQDPLTVMYPGWSPYNYTLGNPVNYIDPDGRAVAAAPFIVVGGGKLIYVGLGATATVLVAVGAEDMGQGVQRAANWVGTNVNDPAKEYLGKLWGSITGRSTEVLIDQGVEPIRSLSESDPIRAKADEIANEIGKNSITLPDGTRIDLKGREHFDKKTGEAIQTPHTHDVEKHVNPKTGEEHIKTKSVPRPTTEEDLQKIEEYLGRGGER